MRMGRAIDGMGIKWTVGQKVYAPFLLRLDRRQWPVMLAVIQNREKSLKRESGHHRPLSRYIWTKILRINVTINI